MHDDHRDDDAMALQRFVESSRRLAQSLRELGSIALAAQLAMLDLAEALDPAFSDERPLADAVIARARRGPPPGDAHFER